VDVKAEHFERQVQRVEQERDTWEKKYEVRAEHGRSRMLSRFSLRILQEAQAKYRESKAELDELVQNMEGL